ncbi:MAG: S41 family peptidase [Solirubrobacterales bacterium]|nr:S41 family peptidase [Solirubrobacterales bacterium]
MTRLQIRVVAVLGGILAAIVMLLAGIWLGGHPTDLPSLLRGSLFESRRNETVTEQALDILTTRYYRPLERSSLVDVGLSGMVASLDDPYSQYVDPRSYRERNEQSTQELGGIGITVAAEPPGLRVVTVVAHSPAAGAGVMLGDLIIKVGSTSLADRSEAFGSDLIRGPVGTTVKLTFMRDGTQHVVSVERAKVVVPVATWQMLTYHHVRIGHLKLTGFTEGSGDELRAEVRAALEAHARALILDLRGNGGGLISEAINVSSAFIGHGEIMSAEERGQPRRVYMARGDAIAAQIPLVVLVDHGTASSAEIVTAALQDHERAEVVGSQTYGKGVFQITERLNNGGALDITIGEFFTSDGRNLGGGGARQGAGITPTIYAPDNSQTPTDDALAVGERTVAAEVQ